MDRTPSAELPHYWCQWLEEAHRCSHSPGRQGEGSRTGSCTSWCYNRRMEAPKMLQEEVPKTPQMPEMDTLPRMPLPLVLPNKHCPVAPPRPRRTRREQEFPAI